MANTHSHYIVYIYKELTRSKVGCWALCKAYRWDEIEEFTFRNYPTRPITQKRCVDECYGKRKEISSSWRTEQQVSMPESCLLWELTTKNSYLLGDQGRTISLSNWFAWREINARFHVKQLIFSFHIYLLSCRYTPEKCIFLAGEKVMSYL